MGRVERGFDFLGYHFTLQGISLVAQTLANCANKALRLYEQEPPHFRVRRLGEYLRRWHRWAVSGGLPGTLAGAGGGAIIYSSVFCGESLSGQWGRPLRTNSRCILTSPSSLGGSYQVTAHSPKVLVSGQTHQGTPRNLDLQDLGGRCLEIQTRAPLPNVQVRSSG
jgi:hypothetical protein